MFVSNSFLFRHIGMLYYCQITSKYMELKRASSLSKIGSISTGLPQLDRVTGISGIPKGRITEISGKWSAGKSTLALQTIIEAQKKGIECYWLDTEFSWDNGYAESLGVDTDLVFLIQSPTAEEGLDTLLEVAREEKDTLMIIDSVGGLHPKDEAEKSSGERTIGAQAGLIARFCRKIVPNLALRNHALIVLNHEYLEIGALRPTIKTSGGEKLSYHKSLWIRLNRTGMNVKVGENIVGYKAEAEIRKNKVGSTERQKCDLEMSYGEGFLASANLFEEALEKGIITRTGNTHFFGETKIGSVSRAKEWTKEHMEEIQHAIAG
jgi:recombination protein RecA